MLDYHTPAGVVSGGMRGLEMSTRVAFEKVEMRKTMMTGDTGTNRRHRESTSKTRLC